MQRIIEHPQWQLFGAEMRGVLGQSALRLHVQRVSVSRRSRLVAVKELRNWCPPAVKMNSSTTMDTVRARRRTGFLYRHPMRSMTASTFGPISLTRSFQGRAPFGSVVHGPPYTCDVWRIGSAAGNWHSSAATGTVRFRRLMFL